MSAQAAPASAITRARNADFLVFGISGFASWMSRVPDVKQILHLTPGALGVMLLAVSVRLLVGLPTAGRLAGQSPAGEHSRDRAAAGFRAWCGCAT